MGKILLTHLSVTSVPIFVFVCCRGRRLRQSWFLVTGWTSPVILAFFSCSPLIIVCSPAVRDINPPSLPHQNHNTPPLKPQPSLTQFFGVKGYCALLRVSPLRILHGDTCSWTPIQYVYVGLWCCCKVSGLWCPRLLFKREGCRNEKRESRQGKAWKTECRVCVSTTFMACAFVT